MKEGEGLEKGVSDLTGQRIYSLIRSICSWVGKLCQVSWRIKRGRRIASLLMAYVAWPKGRFLPRYNGYHLMRTSYVTAHYMGHFI